VSLGRARRLNCAHAEDKQLNIYNWADYIGKENTIAKFEAGNWYQGRL